MHVSSCFFAVSSQNKLCRGYIMSLIKLPLRPLVLDEFNDIRLWEYSLAFSLQFPQRLGVYIFNFYSEDVARGTEIDNSFKISQLSGNEMSNVLTRRIIIGIKHREL